MRAAFRSLVQSPRRMLIVCEEDEAEEEGAWVYITKEPWKERHGRRGGVQNPWIKKGAD